MRDSWKLEQLQEALTNLRHQKKATVRHIVRDGPTEFGFVTEDALKDAINDNWDLMLGTAELKLRAAIRLRAEQMKKEAAKALADN